MPIAVDIADRLFDYTDEEKAAEAIAAFQAQNNLTDNDVIIIWENHRNALRSELEKQIFDAVDANGSVKRAQETVPCDIRLFIDDQ